MLEASGAPLSRSHVMLPTPMVMADRVRVYYASCDADLRGRIFCVDFAPEPPFRLIESYSAPVLDIGPPGQFDCDGVNPCQIIELGDRLGLLYIGWQRGPAERPYTLFGALAVSVDQGKGFTRMHPPQILAPRQGEVQFRTAPFLDRDEQGYRLLYIGGEGFTPGDAGKAAPVYSLMEMRCASPLDWSGPARPLMTPDLQAGELGFGRPVVFEEDGVRKLMISLRTRSGYSLVQTEADFEPGPRPPLTPVLQPPFEDWESQMTCFGAPCIVGDNQLLFYNGDGYGSSGLGLAWRPLV